MTVIRRLVRFHRHLLDEKRRELRDLEAHAASITAQIDELGADLRAEQAVARRAHDVAGHYGSFARASLDRRDRLLQELETATAALTAARETVREMFADVKRYEICDDAAVRRERQAAERRLQGDIDEAALNLHRRNGTR